MSEIHKDIDELLSCYIDDELSDRGRTEIKRLIQHDKNIAAKLGKLRKQKQLLNCLPVAPAPEGLLQEINVSLNSKPAADRYFIDTDHAPALVPAPIQPRNIAGNAIQPAIQRFCVSQLAYMVPGRQEAFLR